MQNEPTDRVIISRVNNGTVTKAPRGARIYVTGPHFGGDLNGGVFSGTADRAEASTYSRSDAERMLRLGKWRYTSPRIESAHDSLHEAPNA